MSNQSRLHVGVILREGPCCAPVFSLEQQHRSVSRIRKGPCQYELASFLSLPSQTQVLGPVRRPALHVVGAKFIEEKKMHDILQGLYQLPALASASSLSIVARFRVVAIRPALPSSASAALLSRMPLAHNR